RSPGSRLRTDNSPSRAGAMPGGAPAFFHTSRSAHGRGADSTGGGGAAASATASGRPHQRRPEMTTDLPANSTPAPAPSRRSFLARAVGASALALPALGVTAPPAGAAPAKK